MDGSAAWPLPAALIIILRWLADQLEKNFMVALRQQRQSFLGRYFKADAKAEGNDVCIGGYEVIQGLGLKSCRWFSVKITPLTAPWAFIKEGEAYRVIASLELFATMLCAMLFVEPDVNSSRSRVFFTGVTDNAGNVALLRKNMTSKFPLYVVLLELTEQLHLRNISLDLRWQARELNQAADDLSNSIFTDFDQVYRIVPDLLALPWLVMPKLIIEAHDLHAKIVARKLLRAQTPKDTRIAQTSKKRKADALRTRDPW
jgi:hypothetical protein